MTGTRAIPLTHSKSARVDASDYAMLSQFRWRAVWARGVGYAHTKVGGAEAFMHRLIMGARPGEEIDHRNGDGLDNRRSNLRPTSHALNQANRRVVGRNSDDTLDMGEGDPSTER